MLAKAGSWRYPFDVPRNGHGFASKPGLWLGLWLALRCIYREGDEFANVFQTVHYVHYVRYLPEASTACAVDSPKARGRKFDLRTMFAFHVNVYRTHIEEESTAAWKRAEALPAFRNVRRKYLETESITDTLIFKLLFLFLLIYIHIEIFIFIFRQLDHYDYGHVIVMVMVMIMVMVMVEVWVFRNAQRCSYRSVEIRFRVYCED